MQGKFTTAPATFTVDAGTTGALDTIGDQVVFDVQGLDTPVIYLNQLVKPATAVTLLVESSVDGTNWATVVSHVLADFTGGANTALQVTNTDAHGAYITMKEVRVTMTALTGTGSYTATVAGRMRLGYA